MNAKVILQEYDVSQREKNFEGIYAGIVVPTTKGPSFVATLVTTTEEYNAKFGIPNPKETLASYSALAYLAKSNKLYVVRAHVDALFGGIEIVQASASGAHVPFVTGQVNPENHTFSTDGLFTVVGADEGDWANDIRVEIRDVDSGVFTFHIDVYQVNPDATVSMVDSHFVSRKNQKDGYGKQMYLEQRINGKSPYIRVVDNALYADTVLPKLMATPGTPEGLASGNNGLAITDGAMMLGADVLANKDKVTMTIVMDAGHTTPAYHNHLIQICEYRKDCMAILGVPIDALEDNDPVAAVLTYRNTTLNANTSWAAMYAAYVKIYDKYNDMELYVPCDGYVGGVYAQTAYDRDPWWAPAGWNRGLLRVLGLLTPFDEGMRDVLQDNGVNPLRQAPGFGIAVWGQMTLQKKPSALDRVNVRMLLIVVENTIKFGLEFDLFEFNDEPTRSRISTRIGIYLESIRARRGVYDFDVVCDTSNNTAQVIDNNEMNVDIYLQPTKVAERIYLRTVITRTGVEFSHFYLKA